MKLTKSRKRFDCYICKSTVQKGDLYAKKSVTIGRPQDSYMENRNGIPVMVEMGFRDTVKICAQCGK
tara:strand:- start:69 stop:269 length:201 start_codon:yes stop_codon:yes gene_type:complete